MFDTTAVTTTGHRPWVRLASVLGVWMLAASLVGPARADDPDNCLLCHQYHGLSRYDANKQRLRIFYVNPEYVRFALGPHARLACTDCHNRDEVSVIPHHEVTKVDCTRTCHLSNPQGLERRFSHADIPDMLSQSVHTPDELAKLEFSGGPLLEPGQSQCLYCHDQPLFRDPTGAFPVLASLGNRTFDRCDTCHQTQVQADIAYYLRHIASRLQPERTSLELAQVCAICHSNPKVLADHNLPDTVSSYVRSFHGKAAMLGDTKTANCLSCHVRAGGNAHLMLPPDNPESAVYPARVADSCRSTACHPGADKRLAAAAVHLDLPDARGTLEFSVAAAFIVLTIFTFGPSMLIVVLELFGILAGRKHHREDVESLTYRVMAHPLGRRLLIRITVHQRIQHWVLAVLFTLLVVTGFPLKFAADAWARTVIHVFGGLEVARPVHHWAGITLVLGLVYHLIYILVTLRQRRTAEGRRMGLLAALNRAPMWLTRDDARKGAQLLAYLLFLRRKPPTFGRFGVKEKFEYIGVFWGTMLLGITGGLLWGEQIASHFLSGRVLNIALIAHTYETFLAVIHVGILHMINVIFSPNVFPLSPATITGTTPPAEMAEAHSEQIEEVAAQIGLLGGQGASNA